MNDCTGCVRFVQGNFPPVPSAPHLGSCTRCPGLAFMEGNMRVPSFADCEKLFLRTGVVTMVRAEITYMRPTDFSPLKWGDSGKLATGSLGTIIASA